jgi:hypothetical protein
MAQKHSIVGYDGRNTQIGEMLSMRDKLIYRALSPASAIEKHNSGSRLDFGISRLEYMQP